MKNLVTTRGVRRMRRLADVCGLRLAAGQAVDRAQAQHASMRRGSAVVLVLGMLAVISLFAAAYLAMGRADRSESRSLAAKERVRDESRAIGDYIAGTIGDDRLAVLLPGQLDMALNGSGPLPQSQLYREASDYPWTDYRRASVPAPVGGAPEDLDRYWFSPEGTLSPQWIPDGNRGITTFEQSDPWLASSTPTWLTPDITTQGGYDEGTYIVNARDWAHISNLAPDGRFVNLFYLRNNFDTPSIYLTKEPGADRPRLTLINPATGLSYPAGSAQILDSYVSLPIGSLTNQANWNVPAHWDSRQRLAFRPAVDPAHAFDEPEYAHYQYADADGDGMFDSRWFELVDSSKSRGGAISLNTIVEQDQLHGDGSMRWFVAARVVDLSSRVNVNSASHLTTAPALTGRLGATPADIDLIRLLQQEHTLSLDPEVQAYRGLSNFGASMTGEDNYFGYGLTGFPGNGTLTIAEEVGQAGFAAMRIAVQQGLVPDKFTTSNLPPLPNSVSRRNSYLNNGAFLPGVAFASNPGAFQLQTKFGLESEAELLTYNGINDPATMSRLEAAIGGRDLGGLPVWQYSPLRSNRPLGVEKSFLKSPLYTSGYGQGNGGYDPNTGQAMPWPIPNSNSDPRTTAVNDLQESPLLQLFVDIRSKLTTHSGAALLRTAPLYVNTTGSGTYAQNLARAMTTLDAFADKGVIPNTLETRFGSETRRSAASYLTQANIHGLFDAFAEALIPYAFDPEVWDINAHPEKRTLTYGFDPYFALTTAAHMAVNMKELYDPSQPGSVRGDQPEVFVLNYGPAASADPYIDHWATDTYDAGTVPSGAAPFYRDLDLNRIRNNTPSPSGSYLSALGNSAPHAKVIFGVEAQPVLTQVHTYHVYRDTPASEGGNSEWSSINNNGQGEFEEVPIDIRGDISDGTNDDVLMQMVSFKLSNPYDKPITLVGLATVNDPPQTVYYYQLRFGGKTYDLYNTEAPDEQLVLGPGETFVFYVVGETPQEINSRFNPNSAPGSRNPDVLGDWVNLQFSGNGSTVIASDRADRVIRLTTPVQTGPVNTSRIDLLAGAPGDHVQSNMEATLWRRMWTSQQEQSNTIDPNSGNDYGWYLADRLRDPEITGSGRPNADRRLPSGQNAVADTMITGSTDPDDSGFTITLSGGFRRPDDLSRNIPRGSVPAWAMERITYDPAISPQPQSSLNTEETSGDMTLSRDRFFASEGSNTIAGWKLKQTFATNAGPSARLLVVQSSMPYTPTALSDTSNIYHDHSRIAQNAVTPSVPFDDLRVELHLANGDLQASQVRALDMMLPLGIGPSVVPGAGTHDQWEWRTLSESLAIATQFDTVSAGTVVGGSSYKSEQFGLDRGQLKLGGNDDALVIAESFVPFVDQDNDFVFDPAVDQRVGLGVPLATTIADIFTSVPVERTKVNTPVVGTVNVNTAPLSVLRLLPGLSPTRLAGQWWWTSNAHTTDSDIASTLYAYIHKTSISVRDPYSSQPAIRFGATTPSNMTVTAAHPNDTEGRANLTLGAMNLDPTGVSGIREQAGMASRAELLSVRDRAASSGGAVPLHDMDRLAFDPDASMIPRGVESLSIYDTPNGQTDLDDGIRNDWDEQLLLANGMIDTVTERSDFFAVWFVMHGYDRSDVEGLRPLQPMTPSVARRYVMVVDRSNVTRLGEKPRILMLKEVPMD
ncbi:MAG: hypothetical protein H6815_13975 [Phycisphaeraceae bacterium]|nr:hypothetical protein [Phycisphaerales bacterium]MCB9861547.1 hypothetical protein [Phycisphaeraceae bacterium]